MDGWQRFAALFRGYEGAFGKYEVKRVNERGKSEGKARTVAGMPTQDDWNRHLEGRDCGLGGIPLLKNNCVSFAAIDVDNYRMDLPQLEEKIKNFPFVLCRSKSGGAHLYIFFKKPAMASVVVEKLHAWAARLGFGGSEIFPKQTERVDERDIGNWINLPYFNAGNSVRYALLEGKALSFNDFLDYAESKQITEEDLESYDAVQSLKSSLFYEGPPCLRQIESIGGFPDGTRNEGMFNVAVYLRKAFPDDWKDRMVTYSGSMCHPALGIQEIQTIIKSADKKDYGYRCKQSPIKEFCNRRECLKCLHGIGEGGGITIEMGNVTKYDGDPVLWGIELGGQRVLVETDILYNQNRFNKICMERINRCPTNMPPARWQRYLDQKI